MLEVASIPMPDGQQIQQFFQEEDDSQYDLVEEPGEIYNVGQEQQAVDYGNDQ